MPTPNTGTVKYMMILHSDSATIIATFNKITE